jgi:hypothetical protein
MEKLATPKDAAEHDTAMMPPAQLGQSKRLTGNGPSVRTTERRAAPDC